MYVDSSNRRVMAHQRPQVSKRTASLPQAQHTLEDVLSNSSVRKVLRWVTRRDAAGKCFFMRLCEDFDNPAVDFWTRLRWAAPNRTIDLALWKAGLNRESMK